MMKRVFCLILIALLLCGCVNQDLTFSKSLLCMDTTMDMLRYDFPNVEHSWLAERFQETYKARHSLTEALALAAANRTIAERVALSLEIQNMLYRVGGDLTNPSLFSKVTDGLNLPGYAAILEKLIEIITLHKHIVKL